ncbi:hypothetical protein [Virgibacillus sediminis]|uniref:Antigen I/II N-terminal domain-containing protein n=1 Tax=Virgibacillus sediminis TaxID=202260 RepID=A0ABV7A980_9BACI
MNKLLLIVLISLFALAACGSEEPADAEGNIAQEEAEDGDAANSEVVADDGSGNDSANEDEAVEVDEGLLNVEITFPASFFDSNEGVTSIEQTIAEAEEMGIDEVIENDDGSLTYKMSKRKHRELMDEYKSEMNATIEEMAGSGDLPSIQDITSNDSFSEFTMVVDQAAFENSFDGFAAVSLGFSGMFYQLLDGVDPDDYEVTINVENAESGEIIDTIIYPDAFEQSE